MSDLAADDADSFPTPVGRHRCLEGYVVLDLSQYLSGPLSAMILAILGATVIKIEPPDTGEGVRNQPPFVTGDGLSKRKATSEDRGIAFLKRNACKLSLPLDLKSEAGYAAFLRLVATSDAVIHNYRPGVPERLKVDAASLKAVNPNLVYCGIDGFGAYARPGDKRSAFDVVIQALSGVMAFSGQPDGPPTLCGAPIGDQCAGLFAAIAVLAGLLQRDGGRSDEGAPDISVSMLNSISMLIWDEHRDLYVQDGIVDRWGNRTPRNYPFDTYRTADGLYVAISGAGPVDWTNLVEATAIPELLARPEWRQLDARVRDREEIDRYLVPWFQSRSREEVLRVVGGRGVTVVPVMGINDIMGDDRFRRAVLFDLDDSEHGETGALHARFPIVIGGKQPGPYDPPAPPLGQDTAALLKRYAGMDDAEIAALAAAGATSLATRNGH